MYDRKHRIYHTVIDFAVEAIALILLAVFLWNMQTSYSVKHQESNSLTKIKIAQQRMEQHAEEADENLETYDSFSQAKLDSVAYYIEQNETLEGMPAMASQWGLSEYYLLGKDGAVLLSKGAAFYTHQAELEQVASSGVAVSIDDLRYYSAALSDGRTLIGARDFSEENAALSELRSPQYSLSTLKVGTTGYVFAYRSADGTIAYHPDQTLCGEMVGALGYDVSVDANGGLNGWVQLNGTRFYGISAACGEYTIVAVIPESELAANNRKMVGLSLLVFAIVMTLIVIYALILRHDLAKKLPEVDEYKKITEHLYLNRTIASKIRNVVLVGLCAVFLISFYMQTLASLSRQSMISTAKLDSVAELLDDNTKRINELTDEYSTEYSRRAQNIAYLLNAQPSLITDDAITVLAQRAQISNVYVFNKQGRVDATNTPYHDFVLSSDENDQSYPFWSVVKGYTDVLVQEPQQDDTLQHNYIQYVGVKRLDADGMVELGISPARLQRRLKSTEIDYVLTNIAVENGGSLFAINKEDGSFVSHAKEKYIGRSAADYGLTASAMKDDYTGIQTIDSVSCLVSSLEYGDWLIYVSVPLTSVYEARLSMSLTVTLASLIAILLMTCLLIFCGKPSAETISKQEEASESGFFRIFQENGRTRVVQSAASRWNGVRQPWSEKSPEQKLMSVTSIFLCVACLAMVLYVNLASQQGTQSSILGYVFSQKWEHNVNVFSMTYAVVVMLEVIVVSTLARKLILFTLQHFGSRSETIGRLLDSFIKYAAIIGGIFYCLNFLGLDSSTLLASVGILSLVVGLGAQSLIGDILAGIFIVFEGEFRVGDIVTIGDWRGTVLEIGIRTTKIESAGNDIKIFRNSSISGVINMTKQFSYAFSDIGVEYGESLERVESVLNKELPIMKQNNPAIVAGPFYKGVASLGDSSVNIRIVAQCKEKDRIQLQRDMNRGLKLIFDKHNINIPFPQVVLNQPSEHEQATRAEKKEAAAFVEEQKELSKDIFVREES